jgi:hypothetical protein
MIMTAFEQQVDKSHYRFGKYYTQARWASIWHQVNEVMRFQPTTVVEVGGGLGIFKQTMSCLGIPVTVVDIAGDLKPDIVGSVTSLPIGDDTFDVACAFQVLEHLPFDLFASAVTELKRVARKAVVLSLPDAKTSYGIQLTLPRLGKRSFWASVPFKRSPISTPEHFWEVEQKGFPLRAVIQALEHVGFRSIKTFRVDDNRYHRFFINTL